MKEIMERDDVEKVNENGTHGEKLYIPHHGIYHPKKAQALQTKTTETMSLVVRLSTFTSWSRAIKAVARLLRRAKHIKSGGHATVSELENAERVIIQDLQSQTYEKEIRLLKKGSQLQ